MPDYRRANVAGGTYFFTLVAHDRRPLLTSDLARCCLRSAFADVQRKRPFRVEAICLLPEHLHCIWCLLKEMMISQVGGVRLRGCFQNVTSLLGAVKGHATYHAGNVARLLCGKGVSGNIGYGMKTILTDTSITSISTL